jgi:hypothetical protein
VTGTDPVTGLTQVSGSLPINVRFVGPPTAVPSGAQTTASATFTLPANVGIANQNLKCISVTGANLTPVAPGMLSISCAFPDSITAAPTVQNVSVNFTVSTGAAIAQLMGDAKVFAPSLIGIPVLALMGLLRRGRSSRKTFFRFLSIVFIFALALQVIGCGGHFTRPASLTNTTPGGSYLLLVQGTGSDNQTYEAVIQLSVIR